MRVCQMAHFLDFCALPLFFSHAICDCSQREMASSVDGVLFWECRGRTEQTVLGRKVGHVLSVTMSGRCLAFVRFGIHDAPIPVSSPSVHARPHSLGVLETWHSKDELRLCHWLEERHDSGRKKARTTRVEEASRPRNSVRHYAEVA